MKTITLMMVGQLQPFEESFSTSKIEGVLGDLK